MPFVKTQTTAITKSTDMLFEVEIRLHVKKTVKYLSMVINEPAV